MNMTMTRGDVMTTIGFAMAKFRSNRKQSKSNDVLRGPLKEEFEINVSYGHNRKRRGGDEGAKWRKMREKIDVR
jgi:hypothetical protein